MLKESDKRVVRAFVNERPASSNLIETDGVRLDKIGLGGETVARWIGGRIAIVSTESVKSDESIIRLISSAAGPGVVDFSYARKGHRVHSHGAMGRNGSGDGTEEDDYVMAILDRDANIGLYRIARGGKWMGPLEKSANVDTIVRAMERDARDRGVHGVAVFQSDGEGTTQVGNVVNGRYQESGGYQGNGQVSSETEYRGMRIEAIENATQLGYYLGEGMQRRPGKGRNIGRQYLIHLGEAGSGGTKMVSTMRAAREYIDEYLGPEQTPNGRSTTVDADAARELDLYIANTFELVGAPNSIGKSIDANLKRKLASGKYDSALAPKAWQYLVDQGAKRYERELGDSSPVFNAATRRQVAEDFARAWEQENELQPNGASYTISRIEDDGIETLELRGVGTADEAIEEAWDLFRSTGYEMIVRRPDGSVLGVARQEDGGQLARNSSSMNAFPEIDSFIRDLDSFLGGVVFDRTIKYSVMGPGSLWVNFINLPHGVGSAGGGAEAENNRVSFNVKFTGDTARVEQVASALDRKYRLRAKSGVPYAIARYLSDFLKKIVTEVNPKFTHSRPR